MLVDDDKAKNKSLPSRERGLKLVLGELLYQLAGSLPSRERGLKYQVGQGLPLFQRSLPSRERGLK